MIKQMTYHELLELESRGQLWEIRSQSRSGEDIHLVEAKTTCDALVVFARHCRSSHPLIFSTIRIEPGVAMDAFSEEITTIRTPVLCAEPEEVPA